MNRRRWTIAGLMGLVLVSALVLSVARLLTRDAFAILAGFAVIGVFLCAMNLAVFGLFFGGFALVRWFRSVSRRREQARFREGRFDSARRVSGPNPRDVSES